MTNRSRVPSFRTARFAALLFIGMVFAASFACAQQRAAAPASSGAPGAAGARGAAAPGAGPIALFSLERAAGSEAVLAGIDAKIGEVLKNSARADLVDLPYALTSSEAELLPEWLRALDQPGARVASLGSITVAPADVDRIRHAATIVAPLVTEYVTHFAEAEGYTVELEVSWSFLQRASGSVVASFAVKTIGRGLSAAAAAADAASQLPIQLSYELAALPGFETPERIVQIDDRTLLLRIGSADGVVAGDRYLIMREGSGEVASIIVIQTLHDRSYATVLFARSAILPNDELRRLPGVGLETGVYLHMGQSGSAAGSPTVVTAGSYEAITRGFADFRPLVGVEAPISSELFGSVGIPITVYAGGQLNWRWGRAALSPFVGLGVVGLLPAAAGQSFSVSAAGGLLQATVSYLLSDTVRIGFDAGYAQWLPLAGGIGFGGFYGGAGVTVRY